MSYANIDLLGVGMDGQLYWDGKAVMVRRGFDLTSGQTVLAWIVAIATVIAAIATAVQAWVAWKGM